jgi:hypothetical protein
MAQIYKTFTKSDLDNKQVVTTTPTINQQVNVILTNFIQYIKDKHM